MGDFSVPPQDLLEAALAGGYRGLHVEQGVPVLDRDLNLLHDLLDAGVRALFRRYIGDGAATDADGFAVGVGGAQDRADFAIAAGPDGPGSYLAGGVEAVIAAPTSYAAQAGVGPLTTPGPADPDPRIDLVYLDVFTVEVDGSADEGLLNSLDVGMQTSVRLRTDWRVRVAEGAALPTAAPGHVHTVLAELRRPRGHTLIDDPDMIVDRRRRRLRVVDIERRVAVVERLLLLPTAPTAEPREGGIGTAVTLTGQHYDAAPLTVRFGAVAVVPDGADATKAVAKVPAGLTPDGVAVSVPITVENEGGSAQAARPFRVLPNPIFAGRQFDPTTGTTGDRITIFGHNLNVAGLQVMFGGVPAPLLGTPTSTEAAVGVPAGAVPAAGRTQNVNLTLAAPGLATDTGDTPFTAVGPVPAPTITTVAPTKGGAGASITITGTNFDQPEPAVLFDQTRVRVPPAQVTATQISVAVPLGLTPRPVELRVSTKGGIATAPTPFTLL